ncbi:MAG: site-2 protease family protein [Nocardioides sp.]|uniref:site-2 protease family protein n=1 Tax=Nocardioides sp. TaxID=35761 RepID=UPI0039E4A8BF
MAHPEQEPDAPAPRPPGAIRLGRLAGADIYVTSSWFLIAALLTVVMAAPIEAAQPGLGAWKYVGGFAFAVLLYLSVLLHEVSHAVMARRYGHPVHAITLHFLGGMTSVEGEARSPRQEFFIAVVGPITSLVVGFVSLLVYRVAPDGVISVALQGLVGTNLLVGLLNLVPGLPLDGGRVMKSIVWAVSGNAHTGTLVAAWCGRLAAVAAMLWPFVQERLVGWTTTPADYLIAFVVAMFLWTGATAAMSSARLRRKLPSLVGRQLARRTLAVPADLPLAEAVRRAQEAQAGGLVTVTTDGRPSGLVSEAVLLATPEERRPWVPVSSVSRTLGEGLSLPADIAGEDLIVAISRRPADEYLLLEDDGSIYGVLATADVDQAFRAAH